MRLRLPAWLAACLLALTAPSPATGLTVAPLTLEQVVAQASLVVHGHVVATASEPAPGWPGGVRTRVTVAVWEVAKGPWLGDLPVVDFVLPGGTRGRLRTVVPGLPSFSPGDEVVLMLEDTAAGLTPVGFALGALHVSPDGAVHGGPSAPRRPLGPLLDHLRTLP